MSSIESEKRSLFHSYASQFEEDYLLEAAGQKHLSLYKKEREEVIRYWEQIKKAKQEKNQITDLVLHKLLPYSNTRHNRGKGHRISVAPAITKDLRTWFENAGWQDPNNWDNVANAIYALIHGLIEENNWECLAAFEANIQVSRGIKAGFITPTLYFLSPKYRIINSKTIDTINFLLGRKAIDRDLTNYKTYLNIIDRSLTDLEIHLFTDADVFDSFCHWMCDKRLGGYARIEKPSDEYDEDDEGAPAFDNLIEPQNHWEAIYYIVMIGNLLGFKTYVADPSRKAFEEKLGDIATLKEIPPILKSAPEIHRIDAVWYKPIPPFFFFEVEDGGTMREALHRLYNALAFDARLFVVSPIHNRGKFEKWVNTAPYKEFEERYNFRTYSEVFAFYNEASRFIAMRSRFLKL